MYQKWIGVGNLGGDPERRELPNGSVVTTFSLACNRKFKVGDESREETIWVRVSVWGAQAESCAKYLEKGRQVLVEGRLKPDENGNPRIWKRADGEPAASFEVTADSVRFLGGSGGGGSSAGEVPSDVPWD